MGIKQITTNEQPIMKQGNSDIGADFWAENIRNNITEIETKNYIAIPDNCQQSWDVSKNGDGSVMAWIVNKGNIDNPSYKLTIAANGNIIIESGARLFANFTKVIKINLSAFDTSKTKSLESFCQYCEKLEYIDITSFDTSQVINMTALFDGCEQLKGIDLSSFSTLEVTSMKAMFRNCKSIESIDVSNFNMDKVTCIDEMFVWCDNLKTTYSKENWNDKSNIVKYNGLFGGDWNLKGVKAYATENIQDISMVNYENGYFTYKD